MSWPWRSPEATRQQLTARTRDRHPASLRSQRLREIAYRRLLARLFATQPERWVVKGGVALLLRLDPNRTSNDIDLAYVAEGGEHAVALKAKTLVEPLPERLQLADAQLADWGPRWGKATRGAPVSFEDAQTAAAALLDPVLSGAADGRRWDAAAQAWR